MPKKAPEHEHFEEPLLQCGSTNRGEKGEELFVGGCGKMAPFSFSYRCGECTAFFHRHCLYEHFKKESNKTKGGSLEKFLAISRKRAKGDPYPSDVE